MWQTGYLLSEFGSITVLNNIDLDFICLRILLSDSANHKENLY